MVVGRKALINKKRENPFKSCPKDFMSALKNKAFQTASAGLKDTLSSQG